ncbi:unnamed protein product [Medioppia subpectinata]|uniref:Bcl-2 Bcl-2 homology region 1-3 domain-containing protein n=1 Tax=Medioppia subpectinata TaxID=1979941 RepID=A0A7R9Q6U3_9ACAR|nr:unnamed protein product [Medioppia subpectinata]CAG2114858.1 unnamed protein product [Medioppia subpectinata]
MATNGSSNVSEVRTNGHNRTDCSLQSIVNEFLCSQLALKGYNWSPEVVANGVHNAADDSHNNQSFNSSQRTKIVDALKTLGHKYVRLYEGQLSAMCERLELSPSTAMTTFNSVSNELFIEGIKWNHIITFLVFGSEFAFSCVQNGFPNLVNEVSHWITAYVTTHLSQWIRDNGDWEYVIEFSGEKVVEGQKKLLYGAAGALGVLTLGLFLRNFSFFK